MPGEVIPLLRVKLLERGLVPSRLRPVEKTPRKAGELRLRRPASRLAGREIDGVAALMTLKVSHRIKRAPKMRLFRSFKLFTGYKRPVSPPPQALSLARRRPVGKFGPLR